MCTYWMTFLGGNVYIFKEEKGEKCKIVCQIYRTVFTTVNKKTKLSLPDIRLPYLRQACLLWSYHSFPSYNCS